LTRAYRLSRERIASFRRDGHVKLDGVFSRKEIAAYRPRLKRVVTRHSESSDSSRFVSNLWALDECARRFVLSRRLGRIAADLLGVDAVRILGDSSFFKGPGCPATAWHQDAPYTPLDPVDTVTFWIALTDLTSALGPICYVSGSHRAGY